MHTELKTLEDRWQNQGSKVLCHSLPQLAQRYPASGPKKWHPLFSGCESEEDQKCQREHVRALLALLCNPSKQHIAESPET